MTLDDIRTLVEYNLWAHRRVWSCIETLTDDQFTHENGYSIGSLHNHCVHLMSVDQRWFARVVGREVPPHLEPADFPTLASVRARWDALETAIRADLAALSEIRLNEIIVYDLPARGGTKRDTRWHILAHVVNHGTDHRAQMLALLHQLGAPTVEQDLTFYLWDD